MNPREDLTTINLALEALGRIEAAKEDLRLCILALGDREGAVLGIHLDELLGEFNAYLEGLLQGCEDNLPSEPGDNGPYGRII